MPYTIIGQNNGITTLEDENGHILRVPSRAVIASDTTFTLTSVNNNMATLEDSNGKVYRDIPCVAVLYGEGGGGGGSLPSQTGNAGKFLTTDGTGASWASTNVSVGGTLDRSLVVGGGTASGLNNTSVGCLTTNQGTGTVCVGFGATATVNNAIALGSDSHATAAYARQIGSGTNSDANTFKVGNENGNFEIMSADGTIPHARLVNAVSSTSVTIATTDWSSNTASVTVSGLTATSVVWVAPDNASQSAYTTAGVYASAQATDTLTFTCTQTPSASLTINVVFC